MRHRRRLEVKDGSCQLRADTDPSSIGPALASFVGPVRLVLNEPLPDSVLAAASDELRRHPQVALAAYGHTLDPSLRWLSGFEHVENLYLDLWQVSSFDRLSGFSRLHTLSLGRTASQRVSLNFLTALPLLVSLSLEGQGAGFDAVGALPLLARLHLRAPKAKSLECLRGHASLAVLTMNFGGIRDLSPLADVPGLRGLELYQVRQLDTADLDDLGRCRTLEALSLGALRNVTSLRALTRGPAATLRILNLEGLAGLTTLRDLASLERLEQLGLYNSRPADKRLDVLLACPRLQHVIAGDVYSRQQVESFTRQFRGALHYRGQSQHPTSRIWLCAGAPPSKPHCTTRPKPNPGPGPSPAVRRRTGRRRRPAPLSDRPFRRPG
jgi:hypothetical protein